jgi:hypothetical protein
MWAAVFEDADRISEQRVRGQKSARLGSPPARAVARELGDVFVIAPRRFRAFLA